MKEEDFFKYSSLRDLRKGLKEGIEILENYMKASSITVYGRNVVEGSIDLSAHIKDETINKKLLEILKERLKEVENEMEKL